MFHQNWREIKRLVKNDVDMLFKVLLGGIIIIIPGLNIIGLGYFQLCIAEGFRRRCRMPRWENWKRMMQEGFEAALIALIYLLIPLIFAFAFISVPFLGMMLAALILLLSLIVIPLAWANRKAYGSFSDAFHFKEMYCHVKKDLYRYVLINLINLVVLTVGILFLIHLPVFGIAGGILIFLSNVMLFFYIGALYC